MLSSKSEMLDELKVFIRPFELTRAFVRGSWVWLEVLENRRQATSQISVIKDKDVDILLIVLGSEES